MVVRSGGWSSQLLQETTAETGVSADRLAAAVARVVPPAHARHRCRHHDRIVLTVHGLRRGNAKASNEAAPPM